jgi:copper chaperone CopZ
MYINIQKIGILCFVFFRSLGSFAQLDTVKIDVIGLTCSSCSKSVEEKLIHVDFVKAVYMNLNLNEAKVVVDFSKEVHWELLSKAVYDAGFSVGAFVIPSCTSVPIGLNGKTCDSTYIYAGDSNLQRINNNVYRLIGKKYMDKKTFRVWKKKMALNNLIVSPESSVYYYY